jgi:hypothetical protein
MHMYVLVSNPNTNRSYHVHLLFFFTVGPNEYILPSHAKLLAITCPLRQWRSLAGNVGRAKNYFLRENGWE